MNSIKDVSSFENIKSIYVFLPEVVTTPCLVTHLGVCMYNTSFTLPIPIFVKNVPLLPCNDSGCINETLLKS